MNLVRPLHDISLAQVAEFGGKAARLGEALRLGCPVPGGLVLSTELYRRFMQQGGLQGEIASILATMQPTAIPHFQAAEWAIRAAFEVRRIPNEVSEIIAEAWRSMGGAPVVVRSSATSEDSPDQSFVGQHATFLGVGDEQSAVAAVIGCWQSLFSAKALCYAHRFGINLLGSSMAVLIQETVHPSSRGALFTADPITGNPEAFVLEVLEGSRQETVRLHPYERQPGEPLAWTQLRRIGLLLDEHLLSYQAIEWAVADGQICLLRVRPATKIPPYLPTHVTDLRPAGVTMELVRPPATTSRSARPYSWYHRSRSERLSAAYYRQAHPLFSSHTRRDDAYLQGYLYVRRRGQLRVPLADEQGGLRRLLRSIHTLRVARSLDRSFRALWASDYGRLRELNDVDLDLISNSDLGRHFREVMAIHERFVEQLGRLGDSHQSVPDILFRLHQHWRLDIVEFWSLLNAERDDLTRRDESLCELASAQYADDSERDEAFRAFFRRHRHLYITGRPLSEGWDMCSVREDERAARSALESCRQDQGRSSQESRARLTAECRRAEERTLAHLRGHNRLVYRELLALARRYAQLRNDREAPVLLCWLLERDVVLQVGRRMRTEGLVATQEEASLLGWRELLAWLDGSEKRDDMVRTLVERRQLYRQWWRYAPPELLSDAPITADRHSAVHTSPSDVFRGLAVSPGQATGQAFVVRSLVEVGNVLPAEVLVCKEPVFELSPLFGLVAAVVSQTGSLLDHAAVLAREYGVPAVFGVAGIMQSVRTGDSLRVDAVQGIVTRERVEPEWDGF